MSKRKRKHDKRNPSRKRRVPLESRSADALTIFWMLSFFATVAAEAAWVPCWILMLRNFGGESLVALTTILFWSASIAGGITLALVPLTLRIRNTPLPRILVLASVAAGLLPFAFLVYRYAVMRE